MSQCVLNSLAGDSLRASWDCIAPYGRFVEIGKTDIFGNSSLPMSKFAKNVSFCAVDMYHISMTNPKLTGNLVNVVTDLLLQRKISHPTPLNMYPLSRTEIAFRSVQNGNNIGRVMISVDHNEIIPKFVVKKDQWQFDANYTYLISGGFGGLGRAILKWMMAKGAKHIAVLSRSGCVSAEAKHVTKELRDHGITLETLKCDVGRPNQLAEALKHCSNAGMPPIKGCINSAMALHDAVLERMSFEQWHKTLQSKIASSWNLHSLLPKDLDFFILLSSLTGIYGSLAQANYAAGCTFQDDLARFRTKNNIEKVSVSLDLGWMVDIGIISEREDYQRNRDNARDMNPITGENLLTVLGQYCDPSRRPITDQDQSQLLVGAVTPVDLRRRGVEVAALDSLPILAGFYTASKVGAQGLGAVGQAEDSPAFLFQQADGRKARAVVVVEALLERLARALYIPKEDINPTKPLSDYGVDSLMAVELRNWIRRDFQATVAVFDIVGDGRSIAAVGQLVVEKSETQ